MDFSSPDTWSALGAILVADLLLSADNAIVIAMAAARLAPEQQGRAIGWGSAAAIVLRFLLTLVAVQMLALTLYFSPAWLGLSKRIIAAWPW